MFVNNQTWKAVKSWASWAARITQVETLAVSVALPIAEAVFVNLWTGAKPEDREPFKYALFVLAAVHVVMLFLLLIRQNLNPLTVAANVLELQEQMETKEREAADKLREAEEAAKEKAVKVEAELARRTDAYRLLRSVLDTLNLQTCQIVPSAHDAFSRGLMPIIQRVACGASGTLGIRSEQFTIELYCGAEYIDIAGSPDNYSTVQDALFYSSPGLDSTKLNLMEPGSAFHWGWYRGVPGTCCIADDKHFFYHGDQPKPDLYFRRFATVPVNLVCSPDRIGLLVITSMQETPFNSDILETMQFLASVISQYIASHSRCVSDYLSEQAVKEAERKAKREERKALKDAEKPGDRANDVNADGDEEPVVDGPASDSGAAS